MRVFIVLLCTLLTAGELSAQTVPLLTAEMVGGNATHNTHVGDTQYSNDLVPFIRYAVSYRIGPAARRGVYLKFDVAPNYFGHKAGSLCQTSSGTACPGPFPEAPGFGFGAGVRQVLTRYVYVGALLGIGRYGAPRSNERTTPFAEADAMVRLIPHVGLIAAARYETWTTPVGRYWYAPFSAGLQIF